MVTLYSGNGLDSLREYLAGVSKSYYRGDSVEFANRTEFHNLFRELFKEAIGDVELMHEVRFKEYGTKRPDFVVCDRVTKKVLGCVETKRLGKKLEDKRFSSQIDHYSRELPLIFTNYIKFQLIVSGEIIFEIDNLFMNDDINDVYEDLKMMIKMFNAYV